MLAVIERLDVRGAVVERVCPLAGLIECKRAIGASAVNDRPRRRRVVINVGGGQLTGRGQRRVFSYGAGAGAANYWRIVGSGDVDGHGLIRNGTLIVGDLHRESVTRLLVCLQRLDVRGAVVERVGPLAGLIDRQRAIGAGAAGNGPCFGRALIDIGGGQLAGRRQRRVFLDQTGAGAGDDRRVVGAGNIDGHGLIGDCALVVSDLHREGVGDGLTLCQRLNVRSGVVDRVGPLAGRIDRQRTVGAGAIGDRPGSCGVVINIGRMQLTGRRQRRVFLDAAGRNAGNHRGVVGTVHSDDDRLRVRHAPLIDHFDGYRVGDLLTGGQCLNVRGAVVERVGPLASGVDRQGTIRASAAVQRRPCVARVRM